MNGHEWRLQRWNVGQRVVRGIVLGVVVLTAGFRLVAQQPDVAAHGQADASADEVLARRVTLHLTNVSLKRAIDSVSRVAHVIVEYQLPLLRAHSAPVTVNVTDVPLGVVLEQVLNGTALRVVSGVQGSLAIVAVQDGLTDSVPSVGSVMGRVVDSASGRSLRDVTIKVAGTKIFAVTADSGRFVLHNVPTGERIVTAKLFGYRPAEKGVTVTENDQALVRINLVPVANVLSGVVTTATGLQRKIEVGNDITTLNVDSVMRVAPITSVTDLLETRVPGLTVLHSSGQPGDPSRLRLRGAGSIQLNNDPIVIVDGIRVYARQSDPRNMNQSHTGYQTNQEGSTIQTQTGGYTAPSPLDQIDPSSIETIEVLKGPSATATYGSDAASGVIVITTKRGRAGPTQWSLNLGQGVNWLPGSWPTTNFRFGQDTTGQAAINGLCGWYELYCAVDSVVAFQALNDPRYTVLGHGNNQQASLTISGGVPAVTYSVTGSGQGNLGMLHLPALVQQQYDSAYGARYGRIPSYLVRPDKYTNVGLDGSLTALPSSSFRVVLQSSLFSSTQQQSSLNGALTQLEGEYISPALLTRGALIENEMERATANALTSRYAVSTDWQLTSWLPLNATGGLSTVQRTDHTYIPFGINVNGIGHNLSATDTTGFYGVGQGTSEDKTMNVSTTVPLSRLVTLAVGGNLVDESTADGNVSTTQLSPGVSVPTQFLRSDGTNEPFTYSTASRSTYGWYVEPRLKVKSRFFATPGFRLDGGSGGSSTTSSGLGGLSGFPKLDLSYLAVDREGSRPLWGFLSQLRPRVAFGLAGIQPQPQDKLRLFNVGLAGYDPSIKGTTPFSNGTGDCQPTLTLDGLTTVQAVCLNTLGNTQLRPERGRELEGGFDAELWQGRLSLSYTQYNKTTHDAILPIPLASSVNGGATIQKNIGVVRNTGTEVTWNATILESRALSWNVGGNLSNNNNLVVRLNPGQAPLCYGGANSPCQGTRIIAGYPLFGVWARPIATFADANQDGIIERNEIRLADSSVYVGQPNPKYQVHLNTGVTLFNGRLSATAEFAYEHGLTQDNVGACNSASFLNLPNNPATPLATEAAIVASTCLPPGIGGSVALNKTTDIGLIQTVNTFRVNSLSINYNVPKAVSAWFRVPRMGLAVQGSNLALHTNYRGKDPDVNAFSTVNAGDETADLGQIPDPRTWWLRVTLGNN